MQFMSRMMTADDQQPMHRYEGRVAFQAKNLDVCTTRIAIAGDVFWPFFQAGSDQKASLIFPTAANDAG